MTYEWWPLAFILIAGWLATDVWRWLGVALGDRLKEESAALDWVKAVATAIIAGVVGKLIVAPTGSLAEAPILLRVAAAVIGWAAFQMRGQSVLVGVLAGEAALLGGWWMLGASA